MGDRQRDQPGDESMDATQYKPGIGVGGEKMEAILALQPSEQEAQARETLGETTKSVEGTTEAGRNHV